MNFSRTATTTFGAVTKKLKHLSDMPPHPDISEFNLQFPTTHANIISAFRNHLRALQRRSNIPEAEQQNIVAVIDSIAASPGVHLPWKEMVKICRKEGVWSVIDAAHSIGQEPNIEVGASGCDFWTSASCLSGYRIDAVDTDEISTELSQMALCQTRVCSSICTQEVSARPFM